MEKQTSSKLGKEYKSVYHHPAYLTYMQRVHNRKMPNWINHKLVWLAMDREVWRSAVHGVTENWTWLSDWTELNCITSQFLNSSPVISLANRTLSFSAHLHPKFSKKKKPFQYNLSPLSGCCVWVFSLSSSKHYFSSWNNQLYPHHKLHRPFYPQCHLS